MSYASRSSTRASAHHAAMQRLRAAHPDEFSVLYAEEKAKRNLADPFPTTRYCPDCDKTLPLGRFYSFTRKLTGRMYYTTVCKYCFSARNARNKQLREARAR